MYLYIVDVLASASNDNLYAEPPAPVFPADNTIQTLPRENHRVLGHQRRIWPSLYTEKHVFYHMVDR